MPEEKFGPFRCKSPRKPANLLSDINFYHCETCGRLMHDFPISFEKPPACCGMEMKQIEETPASEKFGYEIVGGFNNNAVVARWAGENPQWIALKSFVGVYLKLVPPEKSSPVVFALADEDAYAYCGRKVCQKCLYSCKKGCALYFYDNGILHHLPLAEIASYFQV